MSYERRDPDDPDCPGEPTASDVDAAFAEIIARWQDGRPQWPSSHPVDDPRVDDPRVDDPKVDASRVDAPASAGAVDSTPTEEIPAQDLTDLVDDDEDHFVPPEPPPLPRPQPATVGAALLFAVGVVLLAIPSVLGLSDQYGLPLGLLSVTGAIVWLVARLRKGPPADSGWDDGAQL